MKSEWVGQQDHFRKEVDRREENTNTKTQSQSQNAIANANASMQSKEEKEKWMIMLEGRARPYIQQDIHSLVI